MSQNNIQLAKYSFIVGIGLLILKFSAFILTNSNAILSDALESIINVVAGAFAWYSVRLAAMPKDQNHPYGHGKVEFFAAGIEGVLIIVAGSLLLYESLLHFLNPQPINELGWGVSLIAISAIINALLGYLLTKMGKKNRSLTLIADGKHLILDAQNSGILVVGILVMLFTKWYVLDGIISLIFGITLMVNGVNLSRKAVAGLMDETDSGILSKIVELLKANKKDVWIDIHNLRVQQYGIDLHIDCHLTLPYFWNLKEVHQEVHSLEEVLASELYGSVEVFIHTDPCLPQCCQHCTVQLCTKRSSPQTKEIDWTPPLLALNQKHFIEMV